MPRALENLALTAVSATTLIGAVVSAHWIGRNGGFDTCCLLAGLMPLAGLLLLALDCSLHTHTATGGDHFAAFPSTAAVAVLLVFCYGLTLFVANASLIVYGDRGWRLFIGLLVPFIAGAVWFPRRARWLAAGGCLLFLFGSVVALAHNVTHSQSGVGSWSAWLY